jgi:hypothetical protein
MALQKGIVQRDFKPTKILVTIIEFKPIPDVIDFGVTRMTDGKLTDESMSAQPSARWNKCRRESRASRARILTPRPIFTRSE